MQKYNPYEPVCKYCSIKSCFNGKCVNSSYNMNTTKTIHIINTITGIEKRF